VEEKEVVGHEGGTEMNYFDAVPKDAWSLVTSPLPSPLPHTHTHRHAHRFWTGEYKRRGCLAVVPLIC
jgi:hypothetical protein